MKYNAVKQEKEQLDPVIKQIEDRFSRASQLIEGLSGESSRWKDGISHYNKQLEMMLGNCLLASASISFLGPFTSAFRRDLKSLWTEKLKELYIQFDYQFVLHRFVVDASTSNLWIQKGISSDNNSLDNAVII